MNTHYFFQEKGQAMIEAVFVLVILVTLLFAIQFTGLMRTHSIEMLGHSSYLSFLQSTQKDISKNRLITRQSSEANLLDTFSEQLLDIQDQGVIKVLSKKSQTQRTQSIANRLFGQDSVERASFLHINAGQSLAPAQAQKRIAHSIAAWRDISLPTHTILQPYIAPLAKADAPWYRGRLITDWLDTWVGQSPRRKKIGKQ